MKQDLLESSDIELKSIGRPGKLPEEIPAALRAKLEKAKILSQQALANALGIDHSQLRNYLRRERKIPLEVALKLLEIAGYKMESEAFLVLKELVSPAEPS